MPLRSTMKRWWCLKMPGAPKCCCSICLDNPGAVAAKRGGTPWTPDCSGFFVIGDAAAHDDGNPAQLLLGHPLGQRGIEVVGVAGEPARQLNSQAARFVRGAAAFD